jgi:hypothetical protein
MSELSRLPVFFIVGNSRSGTTMMMRVMNNHSNVYSINEPHFFEKMWSPSDSNQPIDIETQRLLLYKLFTGQRAGFFEDVEKHKYKYIEEVELLLSHFSAAVSRLDVYTAFLHYETVRSNKSIPCEKTPQNVFYIEEILKHFPEAKIINMIRDPRGVMLSQKKKWKRKHLGASFITSREVLRLRINYHPITIAKLWNAALSASSKYEGNDRVKNVIFESISDEPNRTFSEICAFLGISFEEEMLLVPHAGSSTEADRSEELGIKKPSKRSWTEKGLTATEIYICEKLCSQFMRKYGYTRTGLHPNWLEYIWLYLIFPLKLILALLFNLNRMRSLADTLKRRLLK